VRLTNTTIKKITTSTLHHNMQFVDLEYI